jgi:PKD repeat protein
VNKKPTAAFSFSCTDLACDFNGGGSTDSDGTIRSYSWSFGASGATASHTFEAAGSYDVTLTVKDDDNASDTETKTVTVTVPPSTS